MEIISSTMAATLGKKALNVILQEVQKTSAGVLKTKLERLRTSTQIGQLYRNLSSIRKVKTIWHTEQAIDLFTFYHSSSIETAEGRRRIDQIDDFGDETRIVLEGTVGQGKSMFLRFLCARELLIGKRIPLFIELRNVGESEGLNQHIRKLLDQLGFTDDLTVFNTLAVQSRIALCLDGFDEIKDSFRRAVIVEIEGLARKYPGLLILITSRPDNGIDKSPFFRVFRLAPLRGTDVNAVIAKLTDDPKLTEDVVRAIARSKARLSQLLTTPLMVTLLVIAYKAEGKIPSTIAEFYESLFNTLFLRHDKLKPGYERVRTCGLSDRVFREVFDTLCFLVRQQQESALKSDEMLKISLKATQVNQQSCDAQRYLDDVKKITCLLLEEGGSYHFIHKSVAEYHAASFVRGRPEDFAKTFYGKLLKQRKFEAWSQDLAFLEQIDRHRFIKYFFLTDVEAVAKCDRKEKEFVNKFAESALEVLSTSFASVNIGVDDGGKLRSVNFTEVEASKFWTLYAIFDSPIHMLLGIDMSAERAEYGELKTPTKKGALTVDLRYFKAGKLLEESDSGISKRIMEEFRNRLDRLVKQIKDAESYLAEKEKQEGSVLMEL